MKPFLRPLLATAFTLAPMATIATQLQIPYTPEFIKFYAEFREAIQEQNKSKILEMSCFPFLSHEIGETFDEKTIKISKTIFQKKDLHKYFLDDPAGEIFSSSQDPQPAHQIYTSARDLIEKNADPRKPLDITTNLRGLFKTDDHSAEISNLKFTERKQRWCWSGADTSEPISQNLRQK